MNWFTAIFALLIGTGCLWVSIKMLRIYFRVSKWKRVEARLISKEIFIHPKYSTTRTPYGLKAEYAYALDGVEYRGHRIYLVELAGGQANHRKSDAEKRLEKIKNPLTVYVNPADPGQSVAYCEGMGMYVFVLVTGCVCILVGIAGLLI
jgi:hypothetical protein